MKKALSIGINDYPFSPLKACVDDATRIAEMIETNEDGSPNFEVKLALNVKTKSGLLSLIKELFQTRTETSLLYFSGHGYLNELGGFILAPDVKKNDEGILMDQILKIANRSEASNKIIILDCCHAGATGLPGDGSAIALKEGVIILASSRDSEESYEDEKGGVFTGILLDALAGGAANINGCVTPASIYAYVDQAVGAWKKQRPVFKSNVSQLTVIRQTEPKVSLKVLRKLDKHFSEDLVHNLDPGYETTSAAPDPVKIEIFKDLQKLTSAGLVTPIDAEHMYEAAMSSKQCRLTHLGYHYWRLAKGKRI